MNNFKKQQKSLGKCMFCGEPIYEYSYGWRCSNKECKSVIYKNDKFFHQFLKKPLTKSKAITLLTGGKVHLTGVQIYDSVHDIDVVLKVDEYGKYTNHYKVYCSDYDILKDPNYLNDLNSGFEIEITGFDILNGE